MALILFSVLLLAVSAFVMIISLNYAWILWERRRVNDLTSKIRHTDEPSVLRSQVSREFTHSFDIKSVGKNSLSRAQTAYNKTIVAITQKEYPSWLQRAITVLERFRANAWRGIRAGITYLMHLVKPPEYDDPTYQADPYKEEIYAQIDDTLHNIQALNKTEGVVGEGISMRSPDDLMQPIRFSEEVDSPISAHNNVYQGVDGGEQASTTSAATLGMVSEVTTEEKSMFEKIENRIIEKLRASRLDNYDIWLELGELYVRYEEKEKAKEVFAFVLRNAKDENKMKLARNFLIGL